MIPVYGGRPLFYKPLILFFVWKSMKSMPTIHDAPWTKKFPKKCYKDFNILPENCHSIEASNHLGDFQPLLSLGCQLPSQNLQIQNSYQEPKFN